MYSTDQYRTQQVDSSHPATSTGNQANSSNSHMSVAAKAGEMQIFSSDILSQVNGLSRRQTTKTIIRPGGKYSSQTNDNKNRFNHIQEQMNNVEEKMLKIDTTKAGERAPTQPAHSEVNQLLQTLQSQVNDRAPPTHSHNQSIGAHMSRDSLHQSQKHQTLPAQQRLHPSQTFSEYMQTNQTLHPKSRMQSNLPAVNNLNNVQLMNQNNSKQTSGEGSTGLSSNAPISNSSSAIGQPISSSYSGHQDDGHTRQISPVLHSHPSQQHLKIEVQSSQQKRTGAQLATQVDQSFTPTMIRRSIGSRSAAKQGERLSFLDKTAPTNQIEMASLEVKNPVPAIPITATIKKIQNQKRDQQQQLLQSRYTNGTEPNMLPKMAGISLERRNANQSKQNSTLPPTGNSMSLIQQGNQRRRHGEGSFGGGPTGNRMSFGVNGESLQIKLTGTSLMNQNRQGRETHSQQVVKEADSSINLGVNGQSQPQSLVYHPKLRKRQPEFSQPYNSVPSTTAAAAQQQFVQQMAEMQMNSPRNSSQIFQDNTQNAKIYSYHYIYNYLFVQVTEAQFEREYAHRIRINPFTNNQTEETQIDERTLNSQNEENIQPGTEQQDPMSSPNGRLRGPPLKLNQNQVFFSPQVTRDSQGKIVSNQTIDQQKCTNDDPLTSRFRTNMSAENTNEHNDYVEQEPHSLMSSEFQSRRQVVKMKKNKIGNALDGSLQSTQYEGLKILTKDTILKARKTLAEIKGKDQIKLVPQLKLENDSKPDTSPELNDDEEQVNKFMSDLGHWLHDQNMRFKVTVKKKYINDILMQSKGAQNLAQNVVMVITNRTTQISMNSPQKRVRRMKRNLSVEVSSGEEEMAENPRANINRSSMRVGGQATPQVTASKAKAHTIGRRGYESENENKSLNSTTTSSTFPNLKAGQGYATKQLNTPRQPRKMSTRSLSQVPNSVRIQRKATDDINGAGAAAGASERADELIAHLNDRYPPAKIKIVHVNKYNDHMDHPINKMLSDYNEFCRLVFRSRVTEAQAMQNIPYAIKLGKRLGMQLNKNQLVPATLKVRENSNAIKEKLIFHMCRVLQRENEFEPTRDDTCKIFNKHVSEHTVNLQENQKQLLTHFDVAKQQAFHYRCYVGKGNNQMLVRSLFKNRFWWLFQEKEEPEKINFFWTQLRKYAIMNSLTCKLVNPKCKNQQRYMKSENQTSPSQGLGLTIANNNALLTPIAATSKIKKRKLSSAQSKSPDAFPNKTNPASSEPGTPVNNNTTSNVAMTLVGAASKPSEVNVIEETKVDIPGVTMAPPQIPVVIPATEAKKEETKKELGRPKVYDTYPIKLANKIEDNYHLCNKKALFVNMKNYYEAIGEDPFDALPVTFHVKEGLDDPNYLAFKQYYEEHADPHNIWITKPGECTNRGVGIQVAKEWDELQQIIVEQTRASKKTCIVQKYIHNPLLIHRRKFDIRTFCMATSYNGNYKAYYYQEGYLRTSCREFSLANLSNRMVHLTNDAVQKKSEDYGKYEPGNKMSYSEFQSYIDKHCSSHNVCFERDILPQIKKLTTDCFRATWGKMDPYKRFNTFECFGLDFMIDEQFKVYLIEVNTNPCLELSSPLLARLIPSMLENSLRLAVDPLFPPPEHFSQRKHVVNELCPENKFELIFDERIDGPELLEIWRNKDNVIIEIAEDELSDADIDRPTGAEKDQD